MLSNGRYSWLVVFDRHSQHRGGLNAELVYVTYLVMVVTVVCSVKVNRCKDQSDVRITRGVVKEDRQRETAAI